MVFKELEIQGFKSFPDKVKISFDTGVTGVVGPNGSGKSNLSDAVRWVLGETSSRQLRAAGKMEESNDRVINQLIVNNVLDNVPEGNAVLHLMGEPQEERLIWLHNEQAVMSPEWSIHAAAGTSNYMFIWGMGGENLNYGDMDKIQYLEMK